MTTPHLGRPATEISPYGKTGLRNRKGSVHVGLPLQCVLCASTGNFINDTQTRAGGAGTGDPSPDRATERHGDGHTSVGPGVWWLAAGGEQEQPLRFVRVYVN